MLPHQRTVDTRLRPEHVHQQQNHEGNEKAQAVEIKRLMIVYDHRIQRNRIACILADDLDAEVLYLARAFQVQELALLAGSGNIDLGHPESVLGSREIGLMRIIGEADLHLQVLRRLGVIQVKVDVVHHLVQVVEIDGRVGFRELVLHRMPQAEIGSAGFGGFQRSDAVRQVNRLVPGGAEIVHVEQEHFQQQGNHSNNGNANSHVLDAGRVAGNNLNELVCYILNRSHGYRLYQERPLATSASPHSAALNRKCPAAARPRGRTSSGKTRA